MMNPQVALTAPLAWPRASEVDATGPDSVLLRCLVLAVLLHALVIMVFGTAPGGASNAGDSVWGGVRITLGGRGPDDSTGRADTPLPYNGPTGHATQPRWGGEVRDAPPKPSPEPGAAELGRWSPTPETTAESRPANSLPLDAKPAPRLSPAPVLVRPAPAAERRNDVPSATSAAPPAVEMPPQTPADPEPAPSTAPTLAPTPSMQAPVLERAPETQQDIAHPLATPSQVLTPPAPTPAPQRDDMVPLAPRPMPQPAAPSVPLITSGELLAPPTLVTPQNLRSSVVPVQPPPLPSPIVVPDIAPAVVPDLPLATRPLIEAPAPQPAAAPAPPPAQPPVAAPATPPAAMTAPPAIDSASVPTPLQPPTAMDRIRLDGSSAPATAPRPDGSATPSEPLSNSLPGSANAGPRVGSPRTAAASTPASAPPLALELPSARAALPGQGARGLLNIVPPPPEHRSRLAEGIEKAVKSDCRTAYSAMGPLAVLPLAIDAARGTGCKW